MLLDNDVVASGKPKPSAFAGGIRCKERVEVFSLTSGGISDAVVTKSLGSESEGTAWWGWEDSNLQPIDMGRAVRFVFRLDFLVRKSVHAGRA
jgi:hypothetical protein